MSAKAFRFPFKRMHAARAFLVVCDEAERLSVLSGVLHRVFPNAVVQTCRDSEACLDAIRGQKFDAVIACSAVDMMPVPLIEHLRQATAAPILVVTDAENGERAIIAGATAFLEESRWLLAGRTIAAMIGAKPEVT